MIKPTLFVNGNIICRCSFCTSTRENFEDVYTHVQPEMCDLTQAIIVKRDFVCASMDVKNHIIACTGEVRAYGEHPEIGNLRIKESITI